jgi:hypothetical protein
MSMPQGEKMPHKEHDADDNGTQHMTVGLDELLRERQISNRILGAIKDIRLSVEIDKEQVSLNLKIPTRAFIALGIVIMCAYSGFPRISSIAGYLSRLLSQ